MGNVADLNLSETTTGNFLKNSKKGKKKKKNLHEQLPSPTDVSRAHVKPESAVALLILHAAPGGSVTATHGRVFWNCLAVPCWPTGRAVIFF